MGGSTGDKSRSSQGRSRQAQSSPQSDGAEVSAAFAFLLGILLHLLNEAVPQVPPPRRAGDSAVRSLLPSALTTPPCGASTSFTRTTPVTSTATELYYADESSGSDDDSPLPSRKQRIRTGQSASSPSQEREPPGSHVELLRALLRGHQEGALTQTPPRYWDGVDSPRRQGTLRVLRSSSAPSRTSTRHTDGQLRAEDFTSTDMTPSPPPSPRSGESLEDYLLKAYNKWNNYQGRLQVVHARAHGSPRRSGSWGRQGSARQEEQESTQHGALPLAHGQRSAGPGRRRSLPFSSHVHPSSSLTTEWNFDLPSPSSDEDSQTFPRFDDVSCHGHTQTSLRRSPSTRPQRPVWSTSAPSPHLRWGGSTAHDEWPCGCNKCHPKKLQRAASVAWSPSGSPEASYFEGQQPSLCATRVHSMYARAGHGGHRVSRASGSSRSHLVLSSKQVRRADGGRQGSPADPVASSTSSVFPQGVGQPLQMTIQFYGNTPSNAASAERRAEPAAPAPANASSRVKRKGLRRQPGTSEAVSQSSQKGSAQGPHHDTRTPPGEGRPLRHPVEEEGAREYTEVPPESKPRWYGLQHPSTVAKPPAAPALSRQPRGKAGSSGLAPQMGSSVAPHLESGQPSSLTSTAGSGFRSRIPVPKRSFLWNQGSAPTSLSLPHTLRSQPSTHMRSTVSPVPGSLRSQLSVSTLLVSETSGAPQPSVSAPGRTLEDLTARVPATQPVSDVRSLRHLQGRHGDPFEDTYYSSGGPPEEGTRGSSATQTPSPALLHPQPMAALHSPRTPDTSQHGDAVGSVRGTTATGAAAARSSPRPSAGEPVEDEFTG